MIFLLILLRFYGYMPFNYKINNYFIGEKNDENNKKNLFFINGFYDISYI